MADYSNPAGRLHDLLKRGKAVNNGTFLRDAWKQLLELDTDDRSVLLARLAKVLTLPGEVYETVRAIPDIDYDVHLRFIPEITKGLSQLNLDGQKWDVVDKAISDTAIYSMEMCSHTIQLHSRLESVAEDDLERVKAQVRELRMEILDSDLPPDHPLRTFLLEEIGKIEQAIVEYRFTGPQGVERTINEATGRFVRDSGLVRFVNHPLTQAFFGLAVMVQTALGITTDVLELTAGADAPDHQVTVTIVEDGGTRELPPPVDVTDAEIVESEEGPTGEAPEEEADDD